MSTKKTRKRYSKEFKLDVIQQSYLRENIRELANELGLRPELIYKWRAVYEDRQPTQQPFPGNGVAILSRKGSENWKLKMLNCAWSVIF